MDIFVPLYEELKIFENWLAVIVTDIEPDKSSKKVGVKRVMDGLSPKVDPRDKEPPAVYRELLVRSEVSKDWILDSDIDVNVFAQVI